MRPLNFAILKLFEGGNEYDVQGVMEQLQGEYASFKVFKPKGVNESLMSAEKNGLLDATRYSLDKKDELHVYYKATEYGENMIRQFIK